MYKSNVKLFFATFIVFVILLLFMDSNYSFFNNKGDDEITDWKVVFTSDTKELKDTQEIKFKVKDTNDVAEGKIAPGMTAVATIEVDITGTKVPAELKVDLDTSNVDNIFEVTTKINDVEYLPGEIVVFDLERNSSFTEENGKIIIDIEAEWIEGNNDTALGVNAEKFSIPVTVNVTQHI